jgi:hypothetical protein
LPLIGCDPTLAESFPLVKLRFNHSATVNDLLEQISWLGPTFYVTIVTTHSIVVWVIFTTLATRSHMFDRCAVLLIWLRYCEHTTPAAMPVLGFSKPVADVDFLSREICQLSLESIVRITRFPFIFLRLFVDHARDIELHAAISSVYTRIIA